MSTRLDGKVQNQYLLTNTQSLFNDAAADPHLEYKSSWVPRKRLFPPLKVKNGQKPIPSRAQNSNIRIGYNEIGHYEKTFIRNLKVSSTTLHTFRSGSGSGKSSFCKSLTNYINVCSAGIDEGYVRPRAIYVNVNPKEASTTDPERPNNRDEVEITGIYEYPDAVSKYTKFVKSQIIAEIESLFQNDTEQIEFLKTHFSKNNENKKIGKRTSRKIRLIFNKYIREDIYDFSDLFWQELEYDTNVSVSDLLTIIGLVSEIKGNSTKIKHPEISDEATVSLSSNLTINHDNNLFENYPLCIFIDNADQFIEVDLRALYDDLKTFQRKRGKVFSNLRIILPLRLSSYSELMGTQIDGDPDYFGSAEPVDIILDRVFDEIFSEKFDVNLYDKDQTLYLSRLFELICVITDHKCDFSNLLFSIAGSNIRLAFKLTYDWLTSEALNPRINTSAEVISSRNALARILANNYAENYVGCIFDIIKSGIVQGLTHIDVASQVESFCLNELRETSAAYEDIPVSHGFRVSRIVQINAKNSLQKIPSDNSIKVIVLRNFKELRKLDVDSSWLADLQYEIDKIIDNAEPDTMVISDMRTYHFALLKSISDLKGKTEVARKLVEGQKKHPNDIDEEIYQALSKPSRQSRFHLSSVLLLQSEMRKGAEEQDFSPVNLFTINGDEISVFPIWLLYHIRERLWSNQKGMNFKRIIRTASRVGINRNDTVDLLMTLTRPDRRLIFSSVDDYHQLKVHGKVSLQRDFLLSWAGHGYLNTLLGTTCYTQWAFSSIDALIYLSGMSKREYFRTYYALLDKEENIIPLPLPDIFSSIIRSISILLPAEESMLRNLQRGKLNEASFRCGSPISDVFLRLGGAISRIVSMSEATGEADRYNDLRNDMQSTYSLIQSYEYKVAAKYKNKNRGNINAIENFLG